MNMGHLPGLCRRPASAEACHFGPRHTSCTHSGGAVRASAGSWTTSAAPSCHVPQSVLIEGNCRRVELSMLNAANCEEATVPPLGAKRPGDERSASELS
jgi:hypothetical protein